MNLSHDSGISAGIRTNSSQNTNSDNILEPQQRRLDADSPSQTCRVTWIAIRRKRSDSGPDFYPSYSIFPPSSIPTCHDRMRFVTALTKAARFLTLGPKLQASPVLNAFLISVMRDTLHVHRVHFQWRITFSWTKREINNCWYITQETKLNNLELNGCHRQNGGAALFPRQARHRNAVLEEISW